MLNREAVEVAGIGSCYVVEMMAGPALAVVMDKSSDHPFALRLLAACLVREDGARVFDSAEAAAAGIPFREYLRLHPMAQRINGLDEADAGKA
jgi:hypothetical protein